MVEYNKVYKKPDGRKLSASNLRNTQLKHKGITITSTEELEDLRRDVETLANNTRAPGMNANDFAEKIDEAIGDISIELEKRYIGRISALESTIDEKLEYIKRLEDKLDKQDEIIYNLTNKVTAVPVSAGTAPVTKDIDKQDVDRPIIDNIIIDPTEKGAEDRFESHVKINEVKYKKSMVSDNVDKLKNLMEKLPK